MRTVRMTLGLLCLCHLFLMPVLLAQRATPHNVQDGVDKYDVFYPYASAFESQSLQDHQNHRQRRGARHARDARTMLVDDEAEDIEDSREGEVSYNLAAPLLFEDDLLLHMIPAKDFISPGFVIQRVSGNSTWLEEIDHLECFYSGYVEGEEDSVVSIAVCDGMRGVINMRGKKYFIEPLKNSSSSSSSNSSSSSLPLHQRPHIIYQQQPAKNHSTSNCSVTENFKHHRLKPGGRQAAGVQDSSHTDFVVNNSSDSGSSSSSSDTASKSAKRSAKRQKRSSGVSRKHRVETLVVADNHMFEYHRSDLQHYVLTLMSIVRNIYRHPSLRNYINIVVVKFIIFQTEEDMPFTISYNAAATLRGFCIWQHDQNNHDHKSVKHHDTGILVTRKDICRAPGKCDTLGLAELGTICDPLRSCSIIEDNGLSSAFTIAHELGHVFNLPHDDDDNQCKDYKGPGRGGKRYHVMAPTLDANSSPWDWSSCSANLMTDFIDAGLAECLRDSVKVVSWDNLVKSYHRPGWHYSADRQCAFVFGSGYGLCPYMNYPTCERLWCTNKTDSPSSGCRTQHMPWADGTRCDENKYCQQGKCVPIPPSDPKPVNGGWGPWSKYGDCSRTCGGGVKQKTRNCDSPVPAFGGRYCLGRRIKYKSCNPENCPADSKDFRIEQCAKHNGKMHGNGLPPHAKWVPKYSGVQLKDACKLYCRASHSTAYFQLSKTVVDGTKCEPFSDDICVNGQCWRAGCDNKLGSDMKRDSCGVCGGDNSSCRTVTGTFNNAIYGYNFVATIPAGATELDIRQYSNGYTNPDDDNYLAMQSAEKKFLLNGEFIVRTEVWMIKVKGGVLEYSGSDHSVERINSTHMLGEPIDLFVLSVGKLQPPNVTFSYIVSAGNNVHFEWSNMGAWRKCSHTCRGKRKRRIVCVREDDNLIVSKKRCKGKHLKKPHRIEENCNTDCIVEWRVFSKEECPVRCGVGMRRQLVHCVKQTGYSQAEIIRDRECRQYHGAKPDEYVPCQGKCLPTFWSYTKWSQCSVTCGSGIQERRARCVDEEGREMPNVECDENDRVTKVACNTQKCPRWQVGDWLGCSVSCGGGRKQRKVWCMLGVQKVDDNLCNKKLRPAAKKECGLKECPEWYPGGWGPCSATCGDGTSMRAVKCRVSTSLLDDAVCDASKRPLDTRPCQLGSCPTTAPLTTTTTTPPAPRAAFWRFGSWTECSTTCGQGSKHRFVSCTGYYDDESINSSHCSHLARPASVQSCMIKPCGDWRSGSWSDCTVTCGEGTQTRYVECMFNEQIKDESFCSTVVKPSTEIRCNRGTCISPDEDDFKTGVITSNRVEGTSRWLTWDWAACSVTCGTGWQQRHVVCYDERGVSDSCDKALKPDEYRNCDSGPCPSWSAEEWSKCSAKKCGEEGLQNRLVYCRLGSTDILPNSNCDLRQRPPDTRQCKKSCSSTYHWKSGPWSSCSVTCGRGQQRRDIRCQDRKGTFVSYDLCKAPKPRNTKRCAAGQCPKWKKGKWSKCSVTCGEGLKTRDIECRNRNREKVSPALCPRQTQPKEMRPCKRKDCSLYVWKEGAWSECSKTCGFGRKHRPVKCSHRQGMEVSSHLCDDKAKPKTKRRCSEFPCPYIWNTGPWSPCSTTCGEGQQMRTVVCQAVTKEGWILPGEDHEGCEPEDRPSFARYCNYGDCRAKYHWNVGEWGTCSAKCGMGWERRRVTCMDRDGQRVDSNQCLRLYRPPKRRQCYSGPCYARSCKELKELTTIRRDGDYKIQVDNQLVTVYCKDMRKPTPIEYLSLPSGESANFAEVYSERLRRHATCPYNRTRPENCDLCRVKKYRQAGNTTYSKVRIDLNTLRIFVNDGAFSYVHGGKFIPFGTAGDCYSSNTCPQGKFSINLVGTGFIVSINTTWMLQGNRATQQIWRLRDGKIIRGLCGGYCGVCAPDHLTGLQLQLSG